MLWIVLVAVIFQLAFMTIASRLGSIQSSSICDMLREKGKSNWAIAVGICVFFIAAAFQSGNNMGIAAVFEELFPPEDSKMSGPNYLIPTLVVIFNSCAIIFLFAFRNLYQLVERMMMFLVALMLLSFTINLRHGRIDDVARGFIPRFDLVDISVLGLIGTTFAITAAFYQAYLVRQKGWSMDDVKAGSTDARIGAGIMGTITIMLMATAAAGLHTESGDNVTLTNPIQIATALEPTFGSTGRWIFCLGLFSAAYSSFLVNSMIGGFVLSDGLGLGCEATDRWPRVFTSLSLLTGMTVAIAAIQFNFDRAPTIIAAQAVTVVGSPLVAIVLVWLASDKNWMGRPLKWLSYLASHLVSMALENSLCDTSRKTGKLLKRCH